MYKLSNDDSLHVRTVRSIGGLRDYIGPPTETTMLTNLNDRK